MPIVTLDDVKHHLRYDDDANDANLTMYIAAAESAIKRYITEEIPTDIPAEIKTAVLMMVGYFDDNRSPDKDTLTNGNYLPQPVTSLIYSYRTPTAV